MSDALRRIDDVETDVTIADGRVTMEADGEATAYVREREHRPLSVEEPHVTLQVSGEDYCTTVRFDGRQADALRDAINHALEWEAEQ